jgi:thiopeptide-type bacteriocin biosynthesis protein
VALVETGPFHPEIARFGGPANLPAVLRLFEIDSNIACALLAGAPDGATPAGGDLLDDLVAVFDSLTAGLGLSRTQRRDLARRLRHAEAALATPEDDDQRRARDADFRTRGPRLRVLLGAPPPARALTQLLAAHREAVIECTGALAEPIRERLAPPLLHLAAVRLCGADRDAEARAYRLWERTLEGLLRSPPPPASPPAPEEPSASQRLPTSSNDPNLN